MFTKINDRKHAENKVKTAYEPHTRVIDGVKRDKKGRKEGTDENLSYADCRCMFGCSRCGWGN